MGTLHIRGWLALFRRVKGFGGQPRAVRFGLGLTLIAAGAGFFYLVGWWWLAYELPYDVPRGLTPAFIAASGFVRGFGSWAPWLLCGLCLSLVAYGTKTMIYGFAAIIDAVRPVSPASPVQNVERLQGRGMISGWLVFLQGTAWALAWLGIAICVGDANGISAKTCVDNHAAQAACGAIHRPPPATEDDV